MQVSAAELLIKSPHKVSIIFPEKEDNHTINLREKCRQLGLGVSLQDKREYQFNYSNVAIEEDASSISEVTIKNWINSLGTSDMFDIDENREKLESLIFSEYPENVLLAICMLNTPKRPIDKYFALWIVLSECHRNEQIKEASKNFAELYLTTEELKSYTARSFRNLFYRKFEQDEIVKDFIDINYLQYWASNSTFPSIAYYTSKIVLSSKNLKKLFNEPKFHNWKSDKIVELQFRIEEGDDLSEFIYIMEYFKFDQLTVKSVSPNRFSLAQMKYLNLKSIDVKNISMPIDLTSLNALENVERLNWEFPDDIYFNDEYFPKLEYINLKGDYVKALEIDNRT